MKSWANRLRQASLPLLAAMLLAGCLPSTDSALDESKEPYYILGQRKWSSYDFKGAVEAFEKAAEANPRSALAHFQLGMLYEQKVSEENSYAIAVYHYNKFLQLRPKSEKAEIVRQHIIACKTELAKPVALAGGTQSVLREIELLKVENAQLKSQLEAWVAYATNRAGAVMPPAAPTNRTIAVMAGAGPAARNPGAGSATLAPPAAPRSHKVQSNETPERIARKYGISTKALLDANPGVDARRLKIGQVLNLPAS